MPEIDTSQHIIDNIIVKVIHYRKVEVALGVHQPLKMCIRDRYGPVKFGGNYVAIQTDLPWADYDNNTNLYNADNVKVSSIKLDGKEYGDLTKQIGRAHV